MPRSASFIAFWLILAAASAICSPLAAELIAELGPNRVIELEAPPLLEKVPVVSSVALAPSGDLLATGGEAGEIRVFKPVRGDEQQRAVLVGEAAVGEWWERAARAAGPIAADGYRVVVLEHDHTTSHHDFGDFGDAQRHADDAASETDPIEPLAVIVDCGYRRVGRGMHYAHRAVAVPSEADEEVAGSG